MKTEIYLMHHYSQAFICSFYSKSMVSLFVSFNNDARSFFIMFVSLLSFPLHFCFESIPCFRFTFHLSLSLKFFSGFRLAKPFFGVSSLFLPLTLTWVIFFFEITVWVAVVVAQKYTNRHYRRVGFVLFVCSFDPVPSFAFMKHSFRLFFFTRTN